MLKLIKPLANIESISWQNSALSWVSSILGTGKSHRGLNLANTVAEAWLRCCFWPKNYRQAMTSEQVKIQQFWNELRCHTLQTQNIRKNCMTWANRHVDILSNFSNSDLTMLHNNFLHCFSVSIGCWRAGPSRASVVIHLFWTFCEELVPLVNTFLTYSTLTVCHFQHFKFFWALNSIFYTKFDPFFPPAENHKQTRNTLCLSQTNKKYYIAETVNIHSGQVCQHGKKESNVHIPWNFKIHLIFLIDPVYWNKVC